tara:strand:+ start:1622 stop:2557 length:936 start_codon:yes stop_codon:yes gene_type:complete
MDTSKSNQQNDVNARRVKKLKDEEDSKKKKTNSEIFKDKRPPPEVLPVQDPDEEDKWGEEIHPHLPQVGGFGGGSLTLLIGAVKTGKSTLLSNLFLNDNMYGQDLFDYVKIMSNTISNDITSRYMKEAYDVDDEYDDSIIHGILENQKKYEKHEQPKIAIICDDLLGSVPRSGLLWKLCSRYRHYNIRSLCISSQNYKMVNNIARQNCQNLIITSPFPNYKEMIKIAEEFGDVVGGQKMFLAIYKYATPNRYDFLHMDLQSNPVKCYSNFQTLIAEGQQTYFDLGSVDLSEFDESSHSLSNKNPNEAKEEI